MLRRILKYAIAAVILFVVLSVISVVTHREYLSQYFSSSLYSTGGLILYLLIFGLGLFLMFRALFRR